MNSNGINIDDSAFVNKRVKTELYNAIRDSLNKPATPKSKKTMAQQIIDTSLEMARKDPKSPQAQWVLKVLFNENILNEIDKSADKFLSQDQDFLEYRVLKTLYDNQRDVFMDDVFRKKLIICSRRVGKSELAARLLVKDAIKPNRHSIYINLTFDNAIAQCYDNTLNIVKLVGLPIESESKTSGEIIFSNGSSIKFGGNKDKAAADKYQGFKFSAVIIDEVQTQRNLQYLIDTILTPATADYEDSKIFLLGTPPRIKGTYIQHLWDIGWGKKYSWDLFKNPYIKNPRQVIEDVMKSKGIDINSPLIQREYFGNFVIDTEAQVFKNYKVYTDIPKSFVPTDAVIGVDYGFSDFNAICPLIFNRNTKEGYIVNPKKFNKATVSTIVDEIRDSYIETEQLCKLLNPDFRTKINIYADTSDKSISFEMKQRYNLPVYPAYKHDKMLAMAQLSDWCRTRIYTPIDSNLTDEFDKTVYKRDDLDNILPEIDDDLYHPDLVDALLYASRAYAYMIGDETGGQSKEAPKVNTTRPQPINFRDDDLFEEEIIW